MSDKNMFGGGNVNSLYTPMSEDEQEVLARLVAEGDFYVHIVGWGWVNRPAVTFGDLRVKVPISITFNAPNPPIPVTALTLELWTPKWQEPLFRKEYDIRQGGKAIPIGAGFNLSMVWDIAVHHMDPRLVKALKPGASGLTTRWADRDTGNITLLGNTRMSAAQRAALVNLRQGEASVRAYDVERLKKAKSKG
jgi:hypothetical protein